jgi:hypothetical protein
VKPQDFKSCVSTNSTTRATPDFHRDHYAPLKEPWFGSFKKIKRAKDGVRTRDLDLGKVALYQLSYFRLYKSCLYQKRHQIFQLTIHLFEWEGKDTIFLNSAKISANIFTSYQSYHFSNAKPYFKLNQ